VKGKIRQYIIDKCMFGEGPLDDEEMLFEGGIMDSIALIKMLSFIEKEFQIIIDMVDVTMEKFSSLNNILQTLEARQKA
jgi:acyl carrier protein